MPEVTLPSSDRVKELERELEMISNELLFGSPDAAERAALVEKAKATNAALTAAPGDKPAAQAGPSDWLGAKTTQLEAVPTLRMPYVPTGIAHLLDGQTPLVSVKITNFRPKLARVRVTVRVDGFSTEAVDTAEIANNKPHTFDLWPVFMPARLREVTELTRASLVVAVEDLDGKKELEKSYPIWLLARTTGINFVTDPSTHKRTDLTHYYGAWVTPGARAIRELVHHVAKAHAKGYLLGYLEKAPPVEAQVEAAFNALKALDLRYVPSAPCYGAWEGRTGQRVRLPSEALVDKVANCLDGTLLMASLLETIGLNPALVIIPGHAFLGWEEDRGKGKWDYLETTMIGTATFKAARDKGRQQADDWQKHAADVNNPFFFIQHAVPDLRSNRGIMPME